jgi:serine/threonine protein kinase
VGTLGEIFGSPQYISPEQTVSSANAEARSDLYSVGVILYEIFTGRLPFEDKDPIEQAMKHLNQPVPPPRSLVPEISPQVETVILKTLAKSPDDRYPNGAALLKALSAALKGRVAPEAPPPSTISSLTIAERVRLQTATRPLPALHTPNQRPASPRPPADAEKPLPPARPRLAFPLLAAAGLAGFLGFVFLCAWVMGTGIRLGGQLLRGDDQPAVTSSLPVDNDSTAGNPLPTTTLSPATGLPATVLPATSTSALPVEYHLQIVKSGQDGLFLLNIGQVELPLELIQLGNPPNYVPGPQFEISGLQPGECVLVRAERKKDKELKEVDCKQVGISLTLEEKKPFWASNFNIYFEKKYVVTCEQGPDECNIRFSVTP